MIQSDIQQPVVLVLEDQPDASFAITRALKPDFKCIEAPNIKTAMTLLGMHSFDAFLLDLNLPDGSSYGFVEHLKNLKDYNDKPILILTASDDISELVLGFDLGVDDFMTKPFNSFELKSRMKARVKKHSLKQSNDIIKVHKDVVISNTSFEAIISNPETHEQRKEKLTRIELKIINLLYKSSPSPLTRDFIGTNISDTEHFDERKVDQHIKNLRKKLKPHNIIHSSYGVGYYI